MNKNMIFALLLALPFINHAEENRPVTVMEDLKGQIEAYREGKTEAFENGQLLPLREDLLDAGVVLYYFACQAKRKGFLDLYIDGFIIPAFLDRLQLEECWEKRHRERTESILSKAKDAFWCDEETKSSIDHKTFKWEAREQFEKECEKCEQYEKFFEEYLKERPAKKKSQILFILPEPKPLI
jgi:hypothetical protein